MAQNHNLEFLAILGLVDETGLVQAQELAERTGQMPIEGFWRITPSATERTPGTTIFIHPPVGKPFRQLYPKGKVTGDTVRILKLGLERFGFDIPAAQKERLDRVRDQTRREAEAAREREAALHARQAADRPAPMSPPRRRRKKWPKEEIVNCDVGGLYALELLEEKGDGSLRARPLSPSNVKRFVGIIKDGFWVPDYMHVDWYGFVINGRHRLTAITEVDTVVPCKIIYGVDPAMFAVFDTPRIRTGGDTLVISEQSPPGSHNQMSAALKLLVGYKSGAPMATWGRERIENEMMSGYANRYPKIYEAMEMAKSFHTGRKKGTARFLPSASIVFCYLALENWPECGLLMDQFMIGVTLGVDAGGHYPHNSRDALRDPRKALYNLMVGAHTKNNAVDQLALLLKTWNFFCTGRTTHDARWRTSGRASEQMPVAVTATQVTVDL